MSAALWLLAGGTVLLLLYATYRAPRLTSALWWSFSACILGTATLIILLPGAVRDRLLWMAFSIPFIWVGLQFWCYWDSRPWRVASSLMLITIAGTAVVLLSEPIL